MPNVSQSNPVWSADQITASANAELSRKQDAADRLTGDSSKSKKNGLEPDKDMFMKLMLAQLKYQNPLEPTDTSQFVNQTAQMNMVEQITNMTKAFEQTVGQNNRIAATQMLGQHIQYDSNGEGEMTTAAVIGVVMGKNPSMRLDNGEVIPLKAVQGVGHPGTNIGGGSTPAVQPAATQPANPAANPAATQAANPAAAGTQNAAATQAANPAAAGTQNPAANATATGTQNTAASQPVSGASSPQASSAPAATSQPSTQGSQDSATQAPAQASATQAPAQASATPAPAQASASQPANVAAQAANQAGAAQASQTQQATNGSVASGTTQSKDASTVQGTTAP